MRKTPEQDALDHIIRGEDKDFLEERFINEYKGKFVFFIQYCFSLCNHLTVLSQCKSEVVASS